jgi:hypothetical protein
MGDITTAALIGAGSSALGGVVGLLSNSAHRQYKYQKRLMNLQNDYNQQNATIAYNRSRQLTQDSPLLEKQGKQMAGINTAFGQNGNVANASSAPQADGVSVPTPPDVMSGINSFSQGLSNATSLLLNAQIAKANIRKLNSESEGNEIDNLTRNYKNLESIGLMKANIKKTFEEAAYQATVNKYADSRLHSEADSAASKSLIDQAESAAAPAMIEAKYNNLIADTNERLARGELIRRQAVTEIRKWSLMKSEELRNIASANESNTAASLNVANTQGKELQNKFDAQTFDYRLVDAFENSEQSKLKTVALKLRNLPHSVSEHFTRSALFALDRIQNGHGSAADFALVSAETAREYIRYSNQEAKDWSKIILGALPMSSSGAASTSNSGYNVNVPYVPQY